MNLSRCQQCRWQLILHMQFSRNWRFSFSLILETSARMLGVDQVRIACVDSRIGVRSPAHETV
jgi:hypothetical protein